MKLDKPTIESNAVYSRREAAQALGVSLSTLKKLVDLGYLEVSRPHGLRRMFIKGSSILLMLDKTTIHSQSLHR
jgi:excisionase family DNA binding protein